MGFSWAGSPWWAGLEGQVAALVDRVCGVGVAKQGPGEWDLCGRGLRVGGVRESLWTC